MGNTKDNMKCTTTKDSKTKSTGEESKILGFMKRKTAKGPEKTPETFADMITQADEKLNTLILTKSAELKVEKGDEDYNQKALALLQTMQFHLDKICELAADYSELR